MPVDDWKQAALKRSESSREPGSLRRACRGVGRKHQPSVSVDDGKRGTYFFKWHRHAPRAFFAAEARGLERLGRAAKTVRIPRVFAWDDPAEDGEGWILLEWIDSGNQGLSSEANGRKTGPRSGGTPPVRGGSLWPGGKQFHRNSSYCTGRVQQLGGFLPGATACAANPVGLGTRTSARTAQPALSPAVRPPLEWSDRPDLRPSSCTATFGTGMPWRTAGGTLSHRSGRLLRRPGGGSRLFGRCLAASPPASTTLTTKSFPFRRGSPRESRCINFITCWST